MPLSSAVPSQIVVAQTICCTAALALYGKPNSTPEQMAGCMVMIRKPATDATRYESVWNEVHALAGRYQMNP